MILLLAIVIGGPDVPTTPRARPAPLPRLTGPDGCAPAEGAEIVVCAVVDDAARFDPADPRFADRDTALRFRLPGRATGLIHAESVELPGARSQRVLATVKIPF